jgi:hypothetical protein
MRWFARFSPASWNWNGTTFMQRPRMGGQELAIELSKRHPWFADSPHLWRLPRQHQQPGRPRAAEALHRYDLRFEITRTFPAPLGGHQARGYLGSGRAEGGWSGVTQHVTVNAMQERGSPLFAGTSRRVLFVVDHLGYPGGVSSGGATYLTLVVGRIREAGVEPRVCVLRGHHAASSARLTCHPVAG